MTAAVRVLLIEPHTDTRELYALALAAEGWEVVAVPAGYAEHRAFFDTSPPAVVVSETWLPDGEETALLNGFADAGAVVVAVTTTPWRVRAPAGLATVLTKPCLPTDLVRVIREILAESAVR